MKNQKKYLFFYEKGYGKTQLIDRKAMVPFHPYLILKPPFCIKMFYYNCVFFAVK